MIRRVLASVALLAALVLLVGPTSSADPASGSPRQTGGSTATTAAGSATSERLPGTTLEAEERDDGGTNAAPWIIGSAMAAAVAVGVGGTILKRRAT